MPSITTTTIGGVNDEDIGRVRFRSGGYSLPVPPPDAAPRQMLDFAAVVALDGREAFGMWNFASLVGRAVDAYRREYLDDAGNS